MTFPLDAIRRGAWFRRTDHPRPWLAVANRYHTTSATCAATTTATTDAMLRPTFVIAEYPETRAHLEAHDILADDWEVREP